MTSSTRWRGWGFGFWAALLWTSGIVFCAAFASWLPVDPNAIDPTIGLRPPSFSHPFGTTRLGEDVFAICIHGARVALIVALGAMAIAGLFGTALGMAAGYFRGLADAVIGVVLDAMIAVPTIVVALAIVLFVGQSPTTVVLVIGVLSIPPFARVTRASTRAVVDREFVLAARMSGARHWRILRRELVPNIAVPLASYLMFIAGIAVLAEGLLSFLGLGVPADQASWGRLVQAGRDNLRDAWWWSLCPAGVIFLTILSLNVLQDRVQARWLGIRRQPKQHPRTGVEVAAPVLTARLLVAHSGRPPVLELVNMYTYLPTPLGMVRAVDGVSLRIEEGRMLAVVGESGAGKSMLAKSILGIAPANAFQRGESRLDGVDLRSLDSRALREQRGRVVGTVLQDPATSLDPVMRIGWQVAEPARVHLGLSRSQARDHAIALLRSVGIPEAERRFRQYPHELSGGQLQRVAIAIALSCSPRLLIADEPTSSLDVIVQRQILDLLDELRRTRRLAVLLITHDLAVATSRAEHVAVMYAGRIVETASAASLANRRAMPYTAGLFDAAPRLATTAHQRLLAIPGRAPGSDGSPHGCAFAPRCTVASEKCVADAPVLGLDDGGEAHRWACWHPIVGAELSVSS